MGRFLWMLAAGAAGYFGFRRLRSMEWGVERGEGEGRGAAESAAGRPGTSPPKPVEAPSSLQERIIRQVTENPGIQQTELYELFPEEDRRTMQGMLRSMDGEGMLRRMREGGTYRLFPPESLH